MNPNSLFSRLSQSCVVRVCSPAHPRARVHVQLMPLHPLRGKPFVSCDDFVATAAQPQHAAWAKQLLQPVATLADALQLTQQQQGYRLAADNLSQQGDEPFCWHLFGGQPLNKTLLRQGEIGHAPFCNTAFTNPYHTLSPTVYGKQFAPYFCNQQINTSHPQLIAHRATACSFPDKVPQLSTHVLVISGGPYVSSYDFAAHATAAEISDFFAVVQQTIVQLQLQGKPYRLATNAGSHANHMVPHFHMHIGHDAAPLAPLVLPWSGHRLPLPAASNCAIQLSPSQMKLQINQLARQLRMQGVTPGQRVALHSPDLLATTIGLLSSWQVGAVVAVCPLREPHSVVQGWLKQLQCRCLLTSSAQHLLPGLPHVLLPSMCTAQTNHVANQLPTQDHHKTDCPPTMLAETTAGTLLRTSGSSAQPKTTYHTLQQHLANAKQAASNVQFGPHSRWLVSLPLYHVGGLGIVCRALATGGSLAFCQPHKQLDLTVLQHLNITHLSVVTTQLQRLLQQPGAREILSRLTAVVVGGGPLYLQLLQQAIKWNVPIVTTYGCSEMASQITATALPRQQGKQTPHALQTDLSKDFAFNKPAAFCHAGCLLADRQLHLTADGEILVKGPMLFCGYVNGNHIEPARDAQGWFHTGDIGLLDCHGNLHVQGRKDNRLISGGENIQAEEIEQALLLHPLVQRAVVLAKPCQQFGQRPIAFVQMANSATLQPQQLRQHLQQHLARFKIPDTFLPWPQQTPHNQLKPPRFWLQSFTQKQTKNANDLA